MIALLLMQQIAVLFLIMGLGFLIVKLGIVETEDSRVLSMVTIYLVLPCVTIHAFQIEYSRRSPGLSLSSKSVKVPCVSAPVGPSSDSKRQLLRSGMG